MTVQKNPFRPFELPSYAGLAAPRDGVLAQILPFLAGNSGLAFVALTGALGVGKSTIACLLLPERLRSEGIACAVVHGSSRLGAAGLVAATAATLGLSRTSVLQDFGLAPDPVSQSVGGISNSKRVSVAQAAATASAAPLREPSAEDIPALLHAFSSHAGKRLVLILDQAEQLFHGERGTALSIIEALVRAASGPGVGVLVVIRDRMLHELFPLASSFPQLMQRILHVPGLEEGEARHVLEKGAARFGVRLSEELVRRVLDRAVGADQRIWPVALQAVGQQLAERARLRGGDAAETDLEAVGDIGGALASAVESAVALMPGEDRPEAIYVLGFISKAATLTGGPTAEELLRDLPAYSATDVERIVKSLVALRLVDRSLRGVLTPAHDAIGLAIRVLQRGGASELDRAVEDWASGQTVWERLDRDAIGRGLRQSALPIAKVVFLAEATFTVAPDLSEDLRERLREQSRSKPPLSLVRLVQTKALRQNRAGRLIAAELFVLFLDDRKETLSAAVDAIDLCAAGPGGSWSGGRLAAALHLAQPTNLADELAVRLGGEHGKLHALSLGLFVRFFARHPKAATRAFVEQAWKHADGLLQPHVLAIARGVSSDLASEYSTAAVASQDPVVRAAALEQLMRGGVDAEGACVAALSDRSAVVRRRAVFVLSDIPLGSRENQLRQAAQDSSPLVREAVMEVVGTLRVSSMQDLVLGGLADPFDFVRESAVYAAKDVMPILPAAQRVQGLVSDPSPRVREAAFRLLDLAGLAPAAELSVIGMRESAVGLATAAVASVGHRVTTEMEDALIELVLSKETPTPVLCAAMRVVGGQRPEDAAAAVGRHLSHEEFEVVAEAVVALQRLAVGRAAEWLAPFISHSSTDIRERVVYALAELGGPSAIEGLRGALWDPSPSVCSRAIYGLARLRDLESARVVRMLPTDSEEVRRAQEYFQRTVTREA